MQQTDDNFTANPFVGTSGNVFENSTFSEIPVPPQNGGGPTTPGAEVVNIDTYIPYLIGIAVLIFFMYMNKYKQLK